MDPVRISAADRFYRKRNVELPRLDLSTYDLQQTLERFGLELGELSSDQLSMILAAKALRPILASLQIDYSDRLAPGDSAASSAEQVRDQNQSNHEPRQESADPGRELDDVYGPLEGLHQIARSLPSELAYINIEPLEFVRRAVTGELQVLLQSPGATTPLEGSPQSPEKPSAAEDSDDPAEWRPLVAHVLLDVSESMGKRDRRGVIARGAALAFILMSFEREAALQLTPFASVPGESSTGTGVSGLKALTNRILTLPNSGSTNIQATLTKIASEALPSQRTDLLLITDGLSTLRSNPLGKAHLHTIRIEVGEGKLNDRLLRDLEVNMAILRQWSDTLIEMDLKGVLELLRPRIEDLLPFTRRLEEFASRFDSIVSESAFDKLAREVDNLAFLCDQFESSVNLERQTPHARRDYQHLRELLRSCRDRLRDHDVHSLIRANESRLGLETANRMRALEELGRPGVPSSADGPTGDSGDFAPSWRSQPGGGTGTTGWSVLWVRFIRMLKSMAARVRRSRT